MCDFCPYQFDKVRVGMSEEYIDGCWEYTNQECPDDKKEWIVASVTDNHDMNRRTAAKLIEAADLSRLAMLTVYGLDDLYFNENKA